MLVLRKNTKEIFIEAAMTYNKLLNTLAVISWRLADYDGDAEVNFFDKNISELRALITELEMGERKYKEGNNE